MLTCTKTYFDIPFAHRQHLHDGHCSFVHGHNWDIRVTFGFLKKWIEENLDHACAFSKKDPLAERLVSAAPEAWKVFFCDECSCEGLARELFGVFDGLVRQNTQSRAFVVSVEISEDKKNTAKFSR